MVILYRKLHESASFQSVFRLLLLFLFIFMFGASNASAFRVRITITDQAKNPLADLKVRAIPSSGGKVTTRTTNTAGRAVFKLGEGVWVFRATCLGYRFSTGPLTVDGRKRTRLVIPHRNITASVSASYNGELHPLENIAVYLLKPRGGGVLAGPFYTDEAGQVSFSLCRRRFCFEAEYLGRRYRSGRFRWQDQPVIIPTGLLVATVMHGREKLAGADVSILSPDGVPLGPAQSSGIDGNVSFYLPPGEYRLAAAHDGGLTMSDPLCVKEDQLTLSIIETLLGSEPSTRFRSVPRQIADGLDTVEISVAVEDADGDDCRLRVEHSTDGQTWLPSTLDPEEIRTVRGSGGAPSIDNGSFYQIGDSTPISTSDGQNGVTFLWDASRDLPQSERTEAYLRLTINDFTNTVVYDMPGTSWILIGGDRGDSGLSATEFDSSSPSVAVDSKGLPHVAWIEGRDEGDAVASLKWNGHEWVDEDGEGREGMIVHQTSRMIGQLSLSLDANDFPRLLWDCNESGLASLYYLERKEGRWLGYNGEPGDAGPIASGENDFIRPRLAIDRQNRSHLLFYEGRGTTRSIYYMLLEGRLWKDQEGGRAMETPVYTVEGQITGSDMVLDRLDRPHIVWLESAARGGVSLRHLFLEEGSWLDLGNDGSLVTTTGYSRLPSLAIGADMEPHIFFEEDGDGTSFVRYTYWKGQGWEPPVTISGRDGSNPSAVTAADGTPTVAYIDYFGGPYRPYVLTREETWKPAPGLAESLSYLPGDVYDIDIAGNAGGMHALAFDVYSSDSGEIFCLAPLPDSILLDTLPPSTPGSPGVVTEPEPGVVSLSFGSPGGDSNFLGYAIEASTDPIFEKIEYAWDKDDYQALGYADYGGEEGVIMPGLETGRTYYFRVTAMDSAGHRSPSPPTGGIRIPEDLIAPGIVIEFPADGAAVPDKNIIVYGLTDDPTADITVNGVPAELSENAFWCPMSLAEGENVLLVRATDPSGNTSEVRAEIISIPFEIISPVQESSVMGKVISINGTCGTNLARITAGPFEVLPANGSFIIPGVYVSAGENTVIIKAYDSSGRFSEKKLIFSGIEGTTGVTLLAEPSTGTAPLDVTLKCEAGSQGPDSSISWDPDGDGVFDTEDEGLLSVNFRFQDPGIYYPAVNLTDPGGVRYQAVTAVVVHRAPVLLAEIPSMEPQDVALDDDGFIYVTEKGTRSVKVYDSDLQPYGVISEVSPGRGMVLPTGITADASGFIWVCDYQNRSLIAFDREGNCYGQWPTGDHLPRDIAVDGRNLYITEGAGSTLLKFETEVADGRPNPVPMGEASLSPPEMGSIGVPDGLAAARGGTIYLSDTEGGRIMLFLDEEGQAQESLDILGAFIEPISSPSVINLSRNTDEMAVVSGSPASISLYNDTGTATSVIDAQAFGDAFLSSPSGIASKQTAEGPVIYIADTGNNRIVVISIPGDNPLGAVEEFRQALLAGDAESAKASLHPAALDNKYSFIEKLSDRLPEVAEWFENVELISIDGGRATCRAIKNTVIGGVSGEFEFEIMLMKDQSGKWKIIDF